MDFAELIEHRQSDRQYLDKVVEREKLAKCLNAARMAPSDHNTQPWRFIVVDDPELKNGIGAAASGYGMNGWCKKAPLIVAVEHFCLQAAELGLGTCILGSYNEKKISKLLGVPRGKRIPLMIAVGYPQGFVRNKTRKSLAKIVSYNKY